MASLSKKNLSCPVCQDIFKDPVVLTCSHSFCKSCLQKCWSDENSKNCPVCKTMSQSDPPCNLALKNLCEAYLRDRDREASKPLCSLHSEKLRLFCLEHGQLICIICRDSKAHSNHTFRPADEAARDYKQELEAFLMPVQEKLKLFKQVEENCDQTAKYIQVQARHTEMQIKEQFKKLHQFLQEEEEARITALREEEKQKTEVMKEKKKGLSRDIEALSGTVRATEKELRAADVSFLQNYSQAQERVLQHFELNDPEPVSGALIDVAKHLGNLNFNIWNKMKDTPCTPVILDPNTAHRDLVLSEDLTSVRREKTQQLPENPERMYYYTAVLGSEGFDSGTHSWDVEVGDSPVWALGALATPVQSKLEKPSKLLKISFYEGEYTADSMQNPTVVLQIKGKFKRIRVILDCDKQKLSFFDPDTNTHIHTFTYNLTEKLFPYFNVANAHPLKIMPVM